MPSRVKWATGIYTKRKLSSSTPMKSPNNLETRKYNVLFYLFTELQSNRISNTFAEMEIPTVQYYFHETSEIES